MTDRIVEYIRQSVADECPMLLNACENTTPQFAGKLVGSMVREAYEAYDAYQELLQVKVRAEWWAAFGLKMVMHDNEGLNEEDKRLQGLSSTAVRSTSMMILGK